MMKRILILCLIFMLFLLAFSFTSAQEIKTINVLMVIEYPHDATILSFLDEFYELFPNIRINVDRVPTDELPRRAAAEFAAQSSRYDIVSITQRNLPSFVEAGHLIPLNEFIKDDPDFQPETVVPGMVPEYSGQIMGWPVRPAAGQIQIYNKEMFAEAGIDRPAQDFHELLEYHKKFYDPPNRYGIVLDMMERHIAYHQFQPVFYQLGGQEFDDHFFPTEVLIDEDIAIETIELLKAFTEYYPPGWETIMQQDSLGMFLTGRLAMRQQYDWIYTYAKDPEQSNVVDKVGLAPFPGPIMGFATCFTIPVYAQNKEEAWKFIRWFNSPEMEARVHKMGPDAVDTIPIRHTTRALPEIKEINPIIDVLEGQEYFPLMQFPGVSSYFGVMGSEIKSAIVGEISPQEAVRRLIEEAEKHLVK